MYFQIFLTLESFVTMVAGIRLHWYWLLPGMDPVLVNVNVMFSQIVLFLKSFVTSGAARFLFSSVNHEMIILLGEILVTWFALK